MAELGGTTIGAIVGAILTGALAKLIDVRGRASSKKLDVEVALRDDLWEQNKEFEKRIREQATDYEARLKACQTESDAWCKRYNETRDKYYEQRALVKRYEEKHGKIEESSGPTPKSV